VNISKILKEEFARVISVLITLLVPLILISYAYKLVYIMIYLMEYAIMMIQHYQEILFHRLKIIQD